MIRIRVTRSEFKLACSHGCVYGEIVKRGIIYAYVELGNERPYQSQETLKIDVKYFINCTVFFAESEEDLQAGKFEAEKLPHVAVLIFC